MAIKYHRNGRGTMGSITRMVAAGSILGLILTNTAGAATVTITDAIRHQTIEGFGGFAPSHQWWLDGPFYNDAHLALMIDTLGVTMIRESAEDFEPVNDNADPNSANLAGFKLNGILAKQIPFWRAIKAKAEASDEPLRFIFSSWSPPAWMKTNNSLNNGGELRTDMYTEFAEYCAEYVKMVQRETGIVPYAFSLQNEPAFVEPYASCVFSPTQLVAAVKSVGARFAAEALATRFFHAEDMLARFTLTPYIGTANADPLAKSYLHSWAFHGYSDGVNPTPASQAAGYWTRVATAAKTAGIPVWMTETEGHDNTWTGGMLLANWISAALKYGKVAAWCYFYLSGRADSDHGFIQGGVPNRRFDAAWHFYRFIRPGAVMIDCISSDTTVMTLAFTHAEKRTLTVLAINFGSAGATVNLTGEHLPSAFTLYRSSESERRVTVGTTGPSGIALPGNSIVTLVAEGYDVSGVSPGDRTALRTSARASGSMQASTVYLLDGRMVRGGGTARVQGAYISKLARGATARICVTPK